MRQLLYHPSDPDYQIRFIAEFSLQPVQFLSISDSLRNMRRLRLDIGNISAKNPSTYYVEINDVLVFLNFKETLSLIVSFEFYRHVAENDYKRLQ